METLHTYKEILQQPACWLKEYAVLVEQKAAIQAFLAKYLTPETDIVLTGAGTSAFIGDAIAPVLRGAWKNVRAVATTDIVTNAADYLNADKPLLLISFARSGNSPESVATVNLANKVCKNIAHIFITCNKNGHLAKSANAENILSLLLPEETDDKSLAMTSSFSTMLLTCLMLSKIDTIENEKEAVEATADLDAAVEATAAATAVAVAENTLTITLVADATIYTLNVELESEPNYMVIEDEITNLVIDLENMAIIGGPSKMWQVEVFLGLAEDDNMDGQWSLSPESSVAVMGFDARIIDGYVYDIDVNAPAAKAVLHVEDSGFFYEYRLNMTNTPQEAIVVVVEDATVQIDTIPLFGDQVDYALKMTADWTYAEDGVTYPVLVEVPVYYPEATEPSEMTCTVTIGGWGDTDPWLGFGEGPLTITTVDGVVTAKGIIANPYTGVAFDVTVSGKLPQGTGSGVDNVQVEVKTVKMIKNGQLIIIKNGVEYNVQGAVIK